MSIGRGATEASLEQLHREWAAELEAEWARYVESLSWCRCARPLRARWYMGHAMDLRCGKLIRPGGPRYFRRGPNAGIAPDRNVPRESASESHFLFR